jgi:hypothetical protein
MFKFDFSPRLAAGKMGLSRLNFISIRRYIAPDFGLESPTAGHGLTYATAVWGMTHL